MHTWRNGQVVVCDRAAIARQYMRQTLEEGGLRIREAGSLTDALEAIRTSRPDLIITDIVFAEADGIEVIRQILAAARQTPVLVCSALADRESVMAVQRAGAIDFLVKPVRPERLAEALQQISRSMT